ncbi:glycosyltransferase [Winogradskyella sp.]|nr:glycosyltransferase family 2 protein [Winogradskyella sp.]MDA8874518.1 glycosyltransferase [Winogradskyella sp.]
MQPLISIIIPSYNRANLIGETLDSIIAQTYQKWECIIVDDGSTDNSAEVVGKYASIDKRIQFYKRPNTRPKGANSCRNYGFEFSKGEYVNWFDSDDIMHNKKLELQIELLQNSNLNFCIGKTAKFKFSVDNTVGKLNTYASSETTFEDFITKKNIWLTQAPIFKKEFLTSNNLKFDEDLQAGQEWDFFSRVLDVDTKYGFIDEILVYFRVHQNSISTNKSINMYWHYYLARKKIFTYFNSKFSRDTKLYFLNYFIESYFIMASHRDLTKAKSVMVQILKDFNLSAVKKFQLKLSYVLFKYFGKGYFLIKKLKQ